MPDVTNHAIGWDEDFSQDEPEFKVLPEGEYDFTVTNFERIQYGGSEKLPPCMKIAVTMQCTDGVNLGKVVENFYCANSTVWRLGALLSAVGLKKKSEPTKPSMIAQAIGLTGRCKLTVSKRTYEGKEYTNNDVAQFFEKAVNPMAGFTVAPQAQPPAQFVQPQQVQPQFGGFAAPNPQMWQQR